METRESFCESFVFNHFQYKSSRLHFHVRSRHLLVQSPRMETPEQHVQYI